MPKLLSVNLSSGKSEFKDIDEKIIKQYLGGRGLGAYLYSQNVKTYDDPDNAFYIVPGLLTGTGFPSCTRLELVSSSPCTGCYTASSAGGKFGAYLKSHDILALEVKGVAKSWRTLEISDKGVELTECHDLIGMGISQTQDKLHKLFAKANYSIAAIGQAGENLVKFACVQFDDRAAGRTGTGWHFGNKKLKAIIISKGKFPLALANKDLASSIIADLKEKRVKHEKDNNINTYATAAYTSYANDVQAFPASNYQRNFISPKELKGLDMPEYEKRATGKRACLGCPLACATVVKGKYHKSEIKGPEYETVWSLGANCDNFDIDIVIECNRLCDDYGLDTISTGNILGWYKECVDKELIDDDWNAPKMFELIQGIGERKGTGAKLADGVTQAAKNFGVGKDFVAHSKNLELPAWDPRSAIGMAINYATAPTGGDHCKGWTISEDVSDPKNRFNIKGKVKNAIEKQNKSALIDCIGTCIFADFMYDNDIWVKCIKALTGFDYSSDDLSQIGENVFQLEHKINQKLGQTIKDNVLPPRIVGYEIEVDGEKFTLTQDMFDSMLQEYYKTRGWK
ncbi:MAG: aldehyde ferredoxin oxidoreductase C-terminal domain-containing protein [Patescibacteria group bacterium]|nr:aldehyde ferredoxin oxidoreductase C-terminal domain-containing protein [Patescibacteria group bacterium]